MSSPGTDAADLPALIAALPDPRAYPFPVDDVEVRQTHISAVFLAGNHAYKVKKPVVLEFLDFGTLDRRRHFCEEEVRVNRRLAPEVYLGVVPVTRGDDGRLHVEGSGPVVEWAVKMERLPADASLASRLRQGGPGVEPDLLVALARRLAAFHDSAEAGEHVSAFGRFAVIARHALENFKETEAARLVGKTVSLPVFERLKSLCETTLGRLHGLIDDRADRGVPRETHGDLRLSHVFLRPERPTPGDLVVVDGIEFNERFRHADPVADAAFLVMDLNAKGRRDLARVFADAYFAASGDVEGRALLPFYTSYRAAVRAKVGGMTAFEPEVPDPDRAEALKSARNHWLVALEALEEPSRRPCLLLVGGLPGAGKSTLGRALAERLGFEVIRSDVVRKELAGNALSPAGFGEGLYSHDRTEATYDECLRRAGELVFEGRRVIVDASFREESHRRAFLDGAREWGVPAALLLCQTDPATTRQRLAARAGSGDASDADWSIYLQAAALWEPTGAATVPRSRTIDTTPGPERTLAHALDALRELGIGEDSD